jgi:hypothetical protein
MNIKIDIFRILTLVFFLFSMWMLGEISQSNSEAKKRESKLDSLENEVILLQDALEVRKEEVNLLMQLNKDDFDRVEEIEKYQRLFQD